MSAWTDTVGGHYDVLVIGSGFGGSVAALRLTEKGYSVGVLEAGRRWADEDFATTSWDLKRFLWAPRLGMKGVQRIHALPDVVVLAGAGVGGGSLNYANTLYEPQSRAFYDDPQWAHITDWRAELAPYYDQAKRMLGVVPNPTTTVADEINRRVAEEMGVADTFRTAPVGVFFGTDGHKQPGVEVDDPFFGGAGPRRRGCLEVGECMVGCRHNAKNTLVKNYLYLAERAGAVVHPETTVVRVAPRPQGATPSRRCVPGPGGHSAPAASSPPTRSSSPRVPGAPSICCTASSATAHSRTSPSALGCSPAPTPKRSPAPSSSCATANGTTSPPASRSPHPSTRTTTPTSSRCATARARTRWAY
jgi:cholesterol oxidase